MHPVVPFVAERLAAQANAENAEKMAAYMKTTMPFYGVKSPGQKAIQREAGAAFKPSDHRAYVEAVAALWAQEHREEKYIAIGLAQRWKAFILPQSLPLYEQMIREGQWWDLVDGVAVHLVGGALRAAPEAMWPLMDQWITDDDLWIRRSAILCQNRFKSETDATRLFAYCRARAHETDFFMRKAIGWALREYAYANPQAVAAFLDELGDNLSGLSQREAKKHLPRLLNQR